jgi:hypothetical protein
MKRAIQQFVRTDLKLIACKSRWQYGQSSIEYAIVCTALAFALGVGMIDDHSVLWQLIDALRLVYQKFSYAISLPM